MSELLIHVAAAISATVFILFCVAVALVWHIEKREKRSETKERGRRDAE